MVPAIESFSLPTSAFTVITPASTLIPPGVSPSLVPTYTQTPTPIPAQAPIRALRVDYANYAASRAVVNMLEQKMISSKVNMVALGAGRLDWTYFKWSGHSDSWSSDVQNTGIDFLAEDAARFGKWSDHISAVVDVLATHYIETHPQAAAISADGKASKYLVSTMQLVEGDFGNELVAMLDYIAANYPVDSISLTELAYHTDGYGVDDKAAYMSYTGRSDWPRMPNGQINIDHPSIGEWRSYEIGRFLEKAAATVHKHDKELFMDVNVSWGNLSNDASEYGQNYTVMLKYVDRIVVWDYFNLSGYKPEYTSQIANYLAKFGSDRVILSIGMWAKNGKTISADELRRGMQAAIQSPLPNLWITPSLYLTDAHWQVINDLWSTQ